MLRDPFAQAKNQYDSRQNQPQDQNILSSSPIGGANPSALASQQQAPQEPDFKQTLGKIGIDHNGLMMNDMGRIQLTGRLRQKFGDNFMQNPSAIQALEAFDTHIKQDPMASQQSMNKGLEGANRTLKALLGGNQ